MKFLARIMITAMIFTQLSCASDEEVPEEILDFLNDLENVIFSPEEGSYAGTVVEGTTTIGNWVALVHKNKLFGISTGEDDELLLNGTVDFPLVNGTGTLPNDPTYMVNFTGMIEEPSEEMFSMNGTWSDDETSGTFSGEKIGEEPDGGYVGVAYEGTELVARWVLVLHNSQLIGVSTDQEDEIILDGILSGSSISGTGTGTGEGGATYTITFSGTLENNEMTGTWSDDDGSGEFKGVRIEDR